MTKNPREGGIPKPSEDDINSIIRHASERPESKKDFKAIDEAIIADLNKDLKERKIWNKNYTDRMRELSETNFSEAADWTELYAIIACHIGGIVMAGVEHTPQQVIEIIDKIREGELRVTNVTRSNGLREKVMELLGQ